MASYYEVVNNTPMDMWVKDGVHWGALGGALIGIGSVAAVVLTIATGGIAAAGLAAGYSTAGALIIPGKVLFVSYAIPALITGLVALGSAGGGIGSGIAVLLQASDSELLNDPSLTAEQASEMIAQRDDIKEALKEYTHLKPGESYRWKGTLSLVRTASVVYDNGATASSTVFTGSLHGTTREYMAVKDFKTYQYWGCFKDSSDRLMPVKKSDVNKVEDCFDQCKGYDFFGVEFGYECWCANGDVISPNLDKAVDNTNCQKDGTNRGGSWTISAYKITPSSMDYDMYNNLPGFEKVRTSQCTVSSAPLPGDNKDDPIFGGGGYVGVMTLKDCETLCKDPSTVDKHGRRCMAVEFAKYNNLDKYGRASCALAWGCETTVPMAPRPFDLLNQLTLGLWDGGDVYKRRIGTKDDPPAVNQKPGACWVYYDETALGACNLFHNNLAGNTWFDGSNGEPNCAERAGWWRYQTWSQCFKDTETTYTWDIVFKHDRAFVITVTGRRRLPTELPAPETMTADRATTLLSTN